MVKDRLINLDLYSYLDPRVKSFKKHGFTVECFDEYTIDNEYSTLILVKKGKCMACTGWRESPLTEDVNAAFSIKENEFVLFLPGEPYVLRFGSEDEVEGYKLKDD